MNIELYEQALILVKGGTPITIVIGKLYRNRRGYREATTEKQRAEITRARVEFLVVANQDKPRNQYPRFFVETTSELRSSVEAHCKEMGVPIAQFVNNAIRHALRLAKE